MSVHEIAYFPSKYILAIIHECLCLMCQNEKLSFWALHWSSKMIKINDPMHKN